MLSTAFLLSYDLRPPQRRSSSRLNRRRSRADLNASRRHLDHEQPYTSRKNLIDQSCAPGGLTGRSEGQRSHFADFLFWMTTGPTRQGARAPARGRRRGRRDRRGRAGLLAPCRAARASRVVWEAEASRSADVEIGASSRHRDGRGSTTM